MILIIIPDNKLPTNVRLSVPPGTLMTFMHGVRLKKDENWVSQVENCKGRLTRKNTLYFGHCEGPKTKMSKSTWAI